jgi:hypothetical protein
LKHFRAKIEGALFGRVRRTRGKKYRAPLASEAGYFLMKHKKLFRLTKQTQRAARAVAAALKQKEKTERENV